MLLFYEKKIQQMKTEQQTSCQKESQSNTCGILRILLLLYLVGPKIEIISAEAETIPVTYIHSLTSSSSSVTTTSPASWTTLSVWNTMPTEKSSNMSSNPTARACPFQRTPRRSMSGMERDAHTQRQGCDN